MNSPLYRTFRFLHPDLAGEGEASGLRVSSLGRLEAVEHEESVRQAIYLLLTTTPGERVMRPDYGCELGRLVYSPNDETSAGLAIHYVKRALDLFEPRIDVVHLDAGPNPDEPGRLDVTLDYRVRATQQPGGLTLSLDLDGGQV